MNGLNFSFFNVITLLGSIQGFLLCIMFISSKRFHRTSTRFLVLLVFAVSITSLINALNDIQLQKIYPILAFCSSSWSLLIPFALYYFIHYLLYPHHKFNKYEYLLAFFSFSQSISLMIQMAWYTLAPSGIMSFGNSIYRMNRGLETLGLFYCLAVIILVLRKLYHYQSVVPKQAQSVQAKSIRWLKNTFILISCLWLLWAVPLGFQVLTTDSDRWIFYPLHLGLALIIYWLGYFAYLYRDLWEAPNFETISLNETKKTSELSGKTEEHYQKLLHLMKQEKLYENAALSMTTLAEKTGLSNGYLSQIINQKEGKNFFDFVNAYRVEEVKKRLVDPAYSHYSILGIAFETGFKSKSTFNAVFKKNTGQTPSAFRKQLQNS